MILTAHQPVYLPWLGLFHKIALSERFCVFDIAQYQTKDFNNRNKIKTSSGTIWLSVPVESKGHLEKKLKDIKIVNDGWNRKHFKSIDLAYRKAPFYADYIGELEALLVGKTYFYLADLNFATLEFGLKALGINVPIVTASSFDFHGSKSDLVLDMCRKLGASDYIFGAQGKDYANIDSFLSSKVNPYFQEYVHPVYPQLHGEFQPYMSVIDLLFNVGQKSFDVLMSGNAKSIRSQVSSISLKEES